MKFESWYACEQAWNSFDGSLESSLRNAYEAGVKAGKEEIIEELEDAPENGLNEFFLLIKERYNK